MIKKMKNILYEITFKIAFILNDIACWLHNTAVNNLHKTLEETGKLNYNFFNRTLFTIEKYLKKPFEHFEDENYRIVLEKQLART